MSPQRKKKIAILGGGMGALAAAFELTSQPDWQERYDVTVHALGWRLGGKGASGRAALDHQRIEEHGLHILGGFYDNTFAILAQCYAELNRPPGAPLATMDQAFLPHNTVFLKERPGSRIADWNLKFYDKHGLPWDSAQTRREDLTLKSIWHYETELLSALLEHFSETVATIGAERAGMSEDWNTAISALHGATVPGASILDRLEGLAEDAVGFVSKAVGDTVLPRLLHAAVDLARTINAPVRGQHDQALKTIADHLRRFRDWLHSMLAGSLHGDLLHLLIVMDIGIAAAVGMIADGLLFPPAHWFDIDGSSLEQWLESHGASSFATGSSIIRIVREFLFSSPKGVGAGTALLIGLNLLLFHRGAIVYKMSAGMGDTVFAPLYLALSQRGVRFELFSRVDRLEVSRDGGHVSKVHIGVPIKVKRDNGPYRPLVDVKGLPCWPSEPLYDQLEDGEALRAEGADLEDWWTSWKDREPPRVLEAGKDFDTVVLAISLGAFQYIASELMAASTPLRRMVEQVKTTQTQAMQLWFTPDVKELGWPRPSPLLGTYVEPFNTWADMSQLIPREEWPPGMVGNISYLCNELPDDEPMAPRTDHAYTGRQKARVERNAIDWLQTSVQPLWPLAVRADNPSGLDWSRLVAPPDVVGVDRFREQFWCAVPNPSDRYVQSIPGSQSSRLHTNQAGFANLLLAGDYIATSLSSGMLESATMSGMLAARAIVGPEVIIRNDWLPGGAGSYDPDFEIGKHPLYLQYQANFVPGAPYQQLDSTLYAFALAADYATLTALCDRYLNHGGPVVYRPLASVALLVCAEIPMILPAEPPSWSPENDFGFWVPMLRGSLVDGVFHPESVATFVAFMWVDSDLAVRVGREVYGFPKGTGTLSMPRDADAPASFSVASLAVARYGVDRSLDTKWMTRPIFEVVKEDGGSLGARVTNWHALKETALDQLALLEEQVVHRSAAKPPLAEVLAAMWRTFAKRDVPFAYLKQLPSAENTRFASYQAVIESSNLIKQFEGGGLLPGPWKLTVNRYDSCRIVEALGLKTAGGTPEQSEIVPLFACWLKLDFLVEPGKVIWRAG
jgi:uncharacterized protein with NAD-binding domain and iron-sulfur cluster